MEHEAIKALTSFFARLNDTEWRLFDGDYYQKAEYEIVTPDGTSAIAWPNAGYMCTKLGSFGANDKVMVRKLPPHLQYGRWINFGPKQAEPKPKVGHSVALAAISAIAGVNLGWTYKPACTHSYGLAGGFSTCSNCGPGARLKE